MTQQMSQEKNLAKKQQTDIGSVSPVLPYLAIVMPIKIAQQDLLVLPAYWLLPTNVTPEQVNQSLPKLPSSVVDSLKEILTESLLEDLWLSGTDNLIAFQKQWQEAGFGQWAEKQFLPGVTDNLAHIVEEALTMQENALSFKVASGKIYLARSEKALQNAEYRLYHPLVERFQTHDLSSAKAAEYFVFPAVTLSQSPEPEVIDLNVADEELLSISKRRLLALTLEEMQAVKNHYNEPAIKEKRASAGLSAWPSDVELEIIAQTWSEHCKHKIFNANIEMKETKADGQTQTSSVKSIYKSYIQAATKKLQGKRSDLLSVFKDNSGVVKWNDQYAVCFKVETHNSPCALEPYGGALTGILGVNRDILGTGLGAKPIFNTDILCFAYPSEDLARRPKLLPPEVLMEGVRKGIQDGGNKSGIPTVNGGIVFHPGYRAKPLVFCGTGGILPLQVAGLCGYEKHTRPGDIVVMAGGRVGKDGVHGATFSSEALHEGSPVTAVQIGDPFTQKRLLDFVLAARDQGLITGITDNGAGGLSSSVGEMATLTGGAIVDLDQVPTKYPGLTAWEIIISESQERMTISTNDFSALKTLANKYHVEVSAIGEFNRSGKFEITHGGKTVAAIDLDFLHDGVPELKLEAEWVPQSWSGQLVKLQSAPVLGEAKEQKTDSIDQLNLDTILLKILGRPNVCSREAVIRQYDHEVQGRSVIKPLMGEKQLAACDAAVITPVLGELTGLAVSNGLCPQLSEYDPYFMAQAALDEAIRNAVCVGADPASISILDNFCWPDPVQSSTNSNGKKYLGMLVKTCQGLYDAALIMETPMISGKDSMKNDFDDGVVRLSIPPTLLISAIGKVPDINSCVSSEFKNPGDLIFLLSAGTLGFAGSILSSLFPCPAIIGSLNLEQAKRLYSSLHKAILSGWINSAHDLSDGGLAVSLSESVIGSGLGASIDIGSIVDNSAAAPAFSGILAMDSAKLDSLIDAGILFGEGPGQIVVTVSPKYKEKFLQSLGTDNILYLGQVTKKSELEVKLSSDKQIKLAWQELHSAWTTPLPFA